MKILSIARFLVIAVMLYCNCAYSSSGGSVIQLVAGNDNARVIEGIFQNLVVKHDKEISSLDLSSSQLDSIVYARPSWVYNFGRLCTVREFIAVLFELKDLQSIHIVRDGKYVGFKVKLRGNPSAGFVLYQDDAEYFLKGIIDDDGITLASNTKEEANVFGYFYSAAIGVAMNNGFKG